MKREIILETRLSNVGGTVLITINVLSLGTLCVFFKYNANLIFPYLSYALYWAIFVYYFLIIMFYRH